MVAIEGMDELVGPGSTIASLLIANALKCEIASELIRLGQPPTVFVNPYFGTAASSSSVAECYAEHRRRLVRVFGGAPVQR